MYVPLRGTLAACQRLFTRKLLKVFFRVRLNSSQLKMCNLQRYKKTKTKYNLGKHTPGDNVIRSDLYKGVWTFTGTVLLLWRFKKGAAPQSCWFESKDRMVWDVGFPKFELHPLNSDQCSIIYSFIPQTKKPTGTVWSWRSKGQHTIAVWGRNVKAAKQPFRTVINEQVSHD